MLITKAELEQRADLSRADRDLIEDCAYQYGGFSEDLPDCPLRQAIRGFLVQELEENIVDEQLRKELLDDAAAFADGWDAAIKYVKEI